jgi:hypothetical protein
VFEKMGGRKFVLTMIVLAIGTLIELNTERGVSDGFTALLIGASAVFGFSNAAVSMKALTVKEEQGEEGVETVTVPVVDEVAKAEIAELQRVVTAQQEQIARATELLRQILTVKQN